MTSKRLTPLHSNLQPQVRWGFTLACAFLFITTIQPAAAQATKTSHAGAGTIIFSQGDAAIVRGGTPSKAVKGQTIESGDTLRTGQGQAQIKFSDGGFVALGAQSEFQIEKYVDALNAQQDSFLTRLIKGSMRGITGLIGKRDRRNYKVHTATATLGIRGSAYELSYQPDGSVLARCEQDGIELCTTAGCVGLTAGESAWAFAANQAPVRVDAQADIPPPETGRDPSLRNERVDGNGQSLPALQNPTNSSGGYPNEGGGSTLPGGNGGEILPNGPGTTNPDLPPTTGGYRVNGN